MTALRASWLGLFVAAVVLIQSTAVLTHGTLAAGENRALVLDGTVVTMNATRDVIPEGHVLVRDGRIAAVWRGSRPPDGVPMDGLPHAGGPRAFIYPGLINLHDHPFFAALPIWQPPASHAQPELGRPLGTEPYANRYQWNRVGVTSPIEYRRLVDNPAGALTVDIALNRLVDVIKFDKLRMILGGTTTTQGVGSNTAFDTLLARVVDTPNFGRQKVFSRVGAIGDASAADLALLQGALSAGLVDAFIVHLAEGVRDGDRRPSDPTSSRAEFADLKAKHLLTDATVIVHGVALEPTDFAEMASAPPARANGTGDGLGAKLVWSPLSNLLLYGATADVLAAVDAGVVVSLGTDWSPSGSANLLTELKIADLILRDQFARAPRGIAAAALDRLLVEMVTINPARAVRWDDEVGSIEAGKTADLIVVEGPAAPAEVQVPRSPYRRLIDATEADVHLVLVGGRPVAGDVAVMSALKPGDFDVVSSAAGCFSKAVDVTDPSLPGGDATLPLVVGRLRDGLTALGGDHPPAGGGPSSPFANTWTYLKTHFAGTSGLPDLVFNLGLGQAFKLTPAGEVNLESIALPPLFTADNDWWFATLGAVRDPATGLTAVDVPPYKRYLSNANQIGASGNPFAPERFHARWYSRTACR